MEILKKSGVGILNFVEVVMPVLALLMTFVYFIVNVVARYVMNAPLNACYELCLTGLVWCLLLSAPYAARTHTNVSFNLLYDMMPPVGQLIFRMVGTAFLIFCFAVMFFPCLDWVLFMHVKYTAVLHVRMDIIFFPFVVFNFLTLCHLLYDIAKDIVLCVRVAQGKDSLHKEYAGPEGELEEINPEKSEKGGGI